MIELDSVRKTVVIEKKHFAINQFYQDKYERELRNSIEIFRKDMSLCSRRAGHIDSIICKQVDIDRRIAEINHYSFRLSCIKQIIDCHFERYLIDEVIKGYMFENYPTSMAINGSSIRFHWKNTMDKFILTDKIIEIIDDETVNERPFIEMLHSIDQEVIDLMMEMRS
ncbi:MAG: hypothetical protein AAFY76_02625 [Cyanobacteria bacterium J06649_11]